MWLFFFCECVLGRAKSAKPATAKRTAKPATAKRAAKPATAKPAARPAALATKSAATTTKRAAAKPKPAVDDAEAKLEVPQSRTRPKPLFSEGMRGHDICILRSMYPKQHVRHDDTVGWRATITGVKARLPEGEGASRRKAEDAKNWVRFSSPPACPASCPFPVVPSTVCP